MQKIAFQAAKPEPLLWNYPKDLNVDGTMIIVLKTSKSPFNNKQVESGIYPYAEFLKLAGMHGDQVYPLKLTPSIKVQIGTPAQPIKAGGMLVKGLHDSLNVPRPMVDKFIEEGYLVPESEF